MITFFYSWLIQCVVRVIHVQKNIVTLLDNLHISLNIVYQCSNVTITIFQIFTKGYQTLSYTSKKLAARSNVPVFWTWSTYILNNWLTVFIYVAAFLLLIQYFFFIFMRHVGFKNRTCMSLYLNLRAENRRIDVASYSYLFSLYLTTRSCKKF